MASKKPAVFAREATGLIRTVSPVEGMIFGIANTGPVFALYFFVTIAPNLGTITDMLGGYLLALVATLATVFVYYYFSIAYPRTGGDYVWVSRYLHPMLGFCSTAVGVLFTEFMYLGLGAITIQTVYLGPSIASVGLALHNNTIMGIASLMDNKLTFWILGTLELWGLSILVILGNRWFFRSQNIVYGLVFLGMATLFVGLAVITPGGFASSLNSYAQGTTGATNYYQSVIDSAKKAGWAPPTSSFYHMLMFMPLFIPTVAWSLLSYIGGEVKNTKRAWAVGLFGAPLFTTSFKLAGILLAYRAIGFDFLGALGYNLYHNPQAISLFPVRPYLNFLTGIGFNFNAIIVILISLMVLTTIWYRPTVILVLSRALFAFSFDRLAPEALSRVNMRWNSPIAAILVSLIGSQIFVVIFITGVGATYAFYFINVAALANIIFPYLLLGITAILFPYLYKREYENAIFRGSVAGLPKMVWAGIISTATMGLSILLLLFEPRLGANSPLGLAMVFGSTAVACIIYLVARIVRKRQGLDLASVYKEIPPE